MSVNSSLQIKQQYQLQANLLGFRQFATTSLPVVISNTLKIVTSIPRPVASPILLFLLKHSTERAIERLILDVVEAGNLVDLARRNSGQSPRLRRLPKFRDLVRVRNKIVAHPAESNVCEFAIHRRWFEEEYNDYKKITDLILAGVDLVVAEIEDLEVNGIITIQDIDRAQETVPEITYDDLSSFVECLKNAQLF